MNDTNINYIKIMETCDFFSSPAKDFLINHGIETLGDLFARAKQPNFITMFSEKVSSKNLAKEIIGTVRILRCKYFEEDPLIHANIEAENVGERFGLSTRARCALYRARIDYDKRIDGRMLINLVKTTDGQAKLFRIRNMGAVTAAEILNKVTIVNEYYAKKENKEEDLYVLVNELQRLVEERTRINNNIDILQLKIEEITKENGSGFSK